MPPNRAPSRERSTIVEDEKACGEPWPEGIQQGACPPGFGSPRFGKYSLEHKHHGRGRHVAVVAQHSPRFNQSALPQAEGVLKGRDHFGAPRVADETVDIVDRKPMSGKELRSGISQPRGNKVRNIAGEDRFEAIISDLPSHHVKAAGPSMFTRCDHGGALTFGRQQRSRGAITE